jgi:hypothetical protein
LKDQIEKLDEKSLEIEGVCTGIAFHPSGNYLLATSDLGGIFIFSVENGDTMGVIITEKNIRGCFIDPSGLYVATLSETFVDIHNKILVFEVGTGKKSSELGRLDNIIPQTVKWSNDGKFLLLGGISGILSVWKVPKMMINTIHDMLSTMQSNPFIWQEYPIELEIKQIRGVKPSKKLKEVLVMPEDVQRERGAFVDSVVVLVNRPEKPKERVSSRPPRVSRIHVPEEPFKTNSRSETPVSLNHLQRDYRPTLKHTVNDFYHKKRENFHQTTKKSPIIVKSTLVGSSRTVESIDVECNGPSHNPAHRLYEKIESNRSEDSESRYR